MKTEFGEVGGKARFRAGDAEVRGDRKPEAAADGGALHGRDDRLLGAEDAHRVQIETVDRAEAVGGIALFGCFRLGRFLFLPLRIAEIGAGAERLALRCEHRGADLDILVELLQRVGDLVDQRDVEEVQRRPLDFDEADVAVLLDADVCEFCHVLVSDE